METVHEKENVRAHPRSCYGLDRGDKMNDALLISDLHIGSWYAPWPPGYETDDPRGDGKLRYIQNKTFGEE